MRLQFDKNYKGSKGTTFTEPSQTVPDMAIPLKKLLMDHTRGTSHDINERNGQYFEDLEIPKITDLNDIAEHREKLESQQMDLQDEIDRLEAEQKQKELDTVEPPKPSETAPEPLTPPTSKPTE